MTNETKINQTNESPNTPAIEVVETELEQVSGGAKPAVCRPPCYPYGRDQLNF